MVYRIRPYEIFVACRVRSLLVANAFLDRFVPTRSEAAGDYVYPEFSDHPRHIFTEVSDVLDLLMVEVSETYEVFWHNEARSDIRGAVLMFTSDGGMIAGLLTVSDEPEALLVRLANVVEGHFGYMTDSHAFPSTLSVFELLCRTPSPLSLVEGELLYADDLGDDPPVPFVVRDSEEPDPTPGIRGGSVIDTLVAVVSKIVDAFT
jgi:hypothetical protein